MQPKGVIFSGGPASVTDEGKPAKRPGRCSTPGVRSLPSATAADLSAAAGRQGRGRSPPASSGRADVEIKEPSALYQGVWEMRRAVSRLDEPRRPVTELPPA